MIKLGHYTSHVPWALHWIMVICTAFSAVMAQVMLIGEIEEIIEIAEEADSVSDTLWTQTGLIGNKR